MLLLFLLLVLLLLDTEKKGVFDKTQTWVFVFLSFFFSGQTHNLVVSSRSSIKDP
jgi:hypothetical protein